MDDTSRIAPAGNNPAGACQACHIQAPRTTSPFTHSLGASLCPSNHTQSSASWGHYGTRSKAPDLPALHSETSGCAAETAQEPWPVLSVCLSARSEEVKSSWAPWKSPSLGAAPALGSAPCPSWVGCSAMAHHPFQSGRSTHQPTASSLRDFQLVNRPQASSPSRSPGRAVGTGRGDPVTRARSWQGRDTRPAAAVSVV